MATTTQQLTVQHPYKGVGIALIVISLILIAFDVGVLARCGQGEGVCFDVATHGTSDAALVGFFILFVIGIVLVMYTEGTSSVTRTSSPPPPSSPVTVVAGSPSPPPTVVTVNSPPPPTATVTVSPPR